MTREELMSYVGQEVTVTLCRETRVHGRRGYTPEFSAAYGFRKPGYFTIQNYDFKVSHVTQFISTKVPQQDLGRCV